MNFSDANISYLVFTNSRNDYGVTVESGKPGNKAKNLVDQIARKASDIFDGSMQTLVVLVPIDRDQNRLLAARVFDVGIYAGRPYTLGIVAVITPVRAFRNWSLGALLEKLPPPKPDSDSYSFPSLSKLPGGSAQSDFFVGIDNWDDEHINSLTKEPTCFSDPPGRSIDLHISSPEGGKQKRFVFALMGILAAAILIGCCTITKMPSRIFNVLSTSEEEATETETDDLLMISSQERREIVDLLFDGGFERPAYIPKEFDEIRDMSDEDFSIFIADIAKAMCERMSELDGSLMNPLGQAVEDESLSGWTYIDLKDSRNMWEEKIELKEQRAYRQEKGSDKIKERIRLYIDIHETIQRIIKAVENNREGKEVALEEADNLTKDIKKFRDLSPEQCFQNP